MFENQNRNLLESTYVKYYQTMNYSYLNKYSGLAASLLLFSEEIFLLKPSSVILTISYDSSELFGINLDEVVFRDSLL